ncbi:MAG: DUF2130 domain-containing protein [Acholeplasmatales bacterium]|nr:DUF2130 domain-containing protein [Acholeplasmatales bacterium]
MKKLNVIVKDKNTLILDDSGEKGDIIDLTELNSIDSSKIDSLIEDGKDRAYNERLEAYKESSRKNFELEKENELKDLKQKINNLLQELENEKNKLKEALKIRELELNNYYNDKENKLIRSKDDEIQSLKNEINEFNLKKEIEIKNKLEEKEKILNEKDLDILKLKSDLDTIKTNSLLNEKRIKEEYDFKIKGKDEEIAFYKDLKVKQSTKMLGETLEQHCEIAFNQIRMTAFPNAYFEKDNDVVEGTKGDFIFREKTDDGIEFLSIMFEMKNESDLTSTKHKISDFFDKLDKDRKNKKCEYAIIVTTLEADNELYNNGIVDVSYKYPKMYVIRPQFFIPMITLLRNSALNNIQTLRELQMIREQNIDISNFEASMNDFKDKFSKNYESAATHFSKAIDEIDKSITHLQKIKEELLTSQNQLRLANNKVDDLSIKKLTKNNPTMRLKFEEIKNGND